MRILLAGLAVLGLTATAAANGRDSYTQTIHFKHGAESNIAAGMTFGLILSHDNGATWEWMCEQAIGYGGTYDPDYEYTATGSVFATTFDGLKVMRDGCSFTSTMPGMTFVSRIEQGPDGTIYFAAADPADSKIYKSTDDGVTFPTSGSPGLPNDWWSSIEVAPSNAQRVYVTGYRLDGGNPKKFLLYRSNDGGSTFQPMTMTGIVMPSENSSIDVIGISKTNPDHIYVKVTLTTGTDGDSVYRSTDAGATWTKIIEKNSKFGLAFLVRGDGSCVAGTRELGAWKAANCATVTEATWTDVAGAPHIGCLEENAAGEVFACTQNYAVMRPIELPSDGFGIMKSTDLVTWTGVLKYEDIKKPVKCAADTVQEQQCVQRFEGMQSPWCCLVPQLGITSTEIDCKGALECNAILVDGAPATDPGCCDAGSGSSALLGLLVVGLLLSRKRRP